MEELLKYGANPCEWDFNKTCTPLHCAAATGDIASVKCLIKSRADVNAGLSGKSPLYYAVLSNAEDCVEALLQAGACPNNPQVLQVLFTIQFFHLHRINNGCVGLHRNTIARCG